MCGYHLPIDVTEMGNIVRRFTRIEDLEEMEETCTLDVAKQGGLTTRRVWEQTGATTVEKETVRTVNFAASGATFRKYNENVRVLQAQKSGSTKARIA